MGLTPGDRYIPRESRAWSSVGHAPAGAEAAARKQHVGGMDPDRPRKLALLHRFQDKPIVIRFENVSAPPTMDESVFTNARVRS